MSNQQGNTASGMRERVGVSVASPDAAALLDIIGEAERSGVRQLWMTQNPSSLDSLTMFAAAFMRTERVRLGTSIVPTYPRHPLALAQQAATVAALGPGRLRLGVGPSHRPSIEGVYGLPMEAPLANLREYVGVLRDALWDGQVDHEGRFFTARAKLNSTPRVPLLISALGGGAFRLAGEIADGAISWNCPAPYLLDVALPALQQGAQDAGRPVPPLVAHAWVALSSEAAAIRAAAKKSLSGYARLPFYASMFAAAGFPVQADGNVSDALVDNLVISGDKSAITARLKELLDSGLDELLLTNLAVDDADAERTQLFQLVGQL
jgi:F420-dependent oxidoreductase-like protein